MGSVGIGWLGGKAHNNHVPMQTWHTSHTVYICMHVQTCMLYRCLVVLCRRVVFVVSLSCFVVCHRVVVVVPSSRCLVVEFIEIFKTKT